MAWALPQGGSRICRATLTQSEVECVRTAHRTPTRVLSRPTTNGFRERVLLHHAMQNSGAHPLTAKAALIVVGILGLMGGPLFGRIALYLAAAR